MAGLNDRDLIGVGGKYTIAEAKGEKYIFLYRVYAPTNWGEEDYIDTDSEAGMYTLTFVLVLKSFRIPTKLSQLLSF